MEEGTMALETESLWHLRDASLLTAKRSAFTKWELLFYMNPANESWGVPTPWGRKIEDFHRIIRLIKHQIKERHSQ